MSINSNKLFKQCAKNINNGKCLLVLPREKSHATDWSTDYTGHYTITQVALNQIFWCHHPTKPSL